MSNSIPLKGDNDKKIGAYFAPLRVEAQDSPSLTVKIRAGSFWTADNTVVEYPGGNTPTIARPSANAAWTLVSLSNVGAVVLTQGTSSTTPAIPAPPSGAIPLAAIYLTPSTTTITNDRIQDVRPFARVVDTVPNLSQQLADRPTFDDMNNALLDKADINGTPSAIFTLNRDTVAGNTTTINVDRGSNVNVGIRWNEGTTQWEFTNDGTQWNSLVGQTGTFAPLVHTHVHTDITDWATSVNQLIAAANKADKIVPSAVGNVATLSNTGNLVDSTVNISSLVTTSAMNSALALKANDANVVHNTANETIAGIKTFTSNVVVATPGGLPVSVFSDVGDSGLLITRQSPANPAIMKWDETSQTFQVGIVGGPVDSILTSTIVDGKMEKVPSAISGNLAVFDNAGQVADSSIAAGTIATTSQLNAGLAGKANTVHTHVHTDITDWDNAVNSLITSATIAQNQVTNLTADLSNKVDKVSGAVAGDIATLDSSGNLVDSGIILADLVTTSELTSELAGKANLATTLVGYGITDAYTKTEVDAKTIAATGDVIGSTTVGSGALTLSLAASGVTANTYNNVTVNSKGIVTAGNNVTYLTSNQNITLSGDITGSGSTSINTTLANVNSNVGTFGSSTNVASVTVNAKGLITAASSVAIAFPVTTVAGKTGTVVLTKADVGLNNVTNSLQVVNGGGAPSIIEDVIASIPAAGNAGTLFISTDTKILYRDTGSTWDVIVPNANLIDAVHSAVNYTAATADVSAHISGIDNALGTKANSATTLAGYGITDGVTTVSGTNGNVAILNGSGQLTDSTVSVNALAPKNSPVFQGVPILPLYAKASLPAGVVGGIIFVTDASPNPSMAIYNGTDWIDVVTGVAVA